MHARECIFTLSEQAERIKLNFTTDFHTFVLITTQFCLLMKYIAKIDNSFLLTRSNELENLFLFETKLKFFQKEKKKYY